MNIRDLIDNLESIADDYGDETEVRFASQPSWPFEYSIDSVTYVTDFEAVADEYDWPETSGDFIPWHKRNDESWEDYEARIAILESAPGTVYLVEGSQLGYLPGHVKSEIGWR